MECQLCGMEVSRSESEDSTSRNDGRICHECMEERDDLLVCGVCDRVGLVETFEGIDAFCEAVIEHRENVCLGCAESSIFTPCGHCDLLEESQYLCTEYETPLCEGCSEEPSITDQYRGSSAPSLRDFASSMSTISATTSSVPRPSVHSYNFSPSLNFNGDGPPYFGVEMEIDSDSICNIDNERASDLNEWQSKGIIYMTRDSSLCYGFEVKCHPSSMEYHRDHFPWKDITEIVVDAGYGADEVSTCGLHIHMSKNGTTPINLLKMGLFIYKHPEFWTDVGRRPLSSYSPAKQCGAEIKDQARNLKTDGRLRSSRNAVNYSARGHATVEFRFPQGSVRPSIIRGTIEILHALRSWTKRIGIGSVRSLRTRDGENNLGVFKKFLVKYRKTYPNAVGLCDEVGVI